MPGVDEIVSFSACLIRFQVLYIYMRVIPNSDHEELIRNKLFIT